MIKLYTGIKNDVEFQKVSNDKYVLHWLYDDKWKNSEDYSYVHVYNEKTRNKIFEKKIKTKEDVYELSYLLKDLGFEVIIGTPRWRANLEEDFYTINCIGEIIYDTEWLTEEDDDLYKVGNYFKTHKEAKESSIYKGFHGEASDE